MTWLVRGPEPQKLTTVRGRQLSKLRRLKREPTSKEITGYRCVSEELWKGQFHKCCYCESVIHLGNHDVEHFRPKAEAIRAPGCTQTHGYWWIAFTWNNLLYSCANCNRMEKNSLFPLAVGSAGAVAEDLIFAGESPLLIDPYVVNPAEHIVYRRVKSKFAGPQWRAEPRNKSIMGNYTILTVGLNRKELLEMRERHYDQNISPLVSDFRSELKNSELARVAHEHQKLKRLFSPGATYSLFNFNVLTAEISNTELAAFGLKWPSVMELWR